MRWGEGEVGWGYVLQNSTCCTHTILLVSSPSQSWEDDDYRNARFIDRQKEVGLSGACTHTRIV